MTFRWKNVVFWETVLVDKCFKTKLFCSWVQTIYDWLYCFVTFANAIQWDSQTCEFYEHWIAWQKQTCHAGNWDHLRCHNEPVRICGIVIITLQLLTYHSPYIHWSPCTPGHSEFCLLLLVAWQPSPGSLSHHCLIPWSYFLKIE